MPSQSPSLNAIENMQNNRLLVFFSGTLLFASNWIQIEKISVDEEGNFPNPDISRRFKLKCLPEVV